MLEKCPNIKFFEFTICEKDYTITKEDYFNFQTKYGKILQTAVFSCIMYLRIFLGRG